MKMLWRRWILLSLISSTLGCTDDYPVGDCSTSDARGRVTCTDDAPESGERGRGGRLPTPPREDASPWGPRDAGAYPDGSPGAVPGTDVSRGGSRSPAVLGTCSSAPLAFRPVDVEYSGALDRIVAVTATPSTLSLFDPASQAVQTVALPLPPAAVSVAPDGRTAAVAHDAYVSIVDLVQPAVQVTIPTTSDAADVVLAGNGYAYVFPRTDQHVAIHSVEIATRTDHAKDDWTLYANARARLHPGGGSLYTISRGLSPTDVTRFDIAGGPVAGRGVDSPYHGDYPMCDNVWFSEPGDRLFTGCGSVFRSTPGVQNDLTYAGTLGGGADAGSRTRYRWVVHSAAAHKVYAVPGGEGLGAFASQEQQPSTATQVRVFADDFLQAEPSIDIPCLDTPVGKQRVYGQYVFVDPTGKRLYVIGQLDGSSGAVSDWTSAVVSL